MNQVKLDIGARLDFARRALTAVVDAMPLIVFSPDDRPHLYAVALHASIVQYCGGCLAMAGTEYTAGIPVVLRSMFEAVIDLANLVTDASYYKRMEAADREQVLKVLRESSTNPLLRGLDKKHNIPETIRLLEDDLKASAACNRGKRTIKERSVDVGRENEYRSAYSLLCLDGHNNVTALIERHITEGESHRLEVNAFGDGDPKMLAIRIHQAIGWMLQSAQYVHGAFKSGHSVLELMQEHDSMRTVD